VVVGIAPGWDDTTIELSLFERVDGAWRRSPPWPGALGHAGLAWGRGLHGEGVPAGSAGPQKMEGDGKTPAGLFTVGPAFGYAPRADTSLSYTLATDSLRCIDDPASRHYTKIVDESSVTPDWSSSEAMRRDDDLYRWVIDIDHNPNAIPRGGSCIFFHIWRRPGATTVGCVAMDRARLEALLARLDPAAHPVAVLLPRDQYAALADRWHLPPLATTSR
jgi:L,D-peptidoglycan transpeptidase YkuD (ErfK/YbiS/YcfS/YnhG family)